MVRHIIHTYYVVYISSCRSDNFYKIKMTENSYQCRIETSSLANTRDSKLEETRYSSDLGSTHSMRSNDKDNGSTARSERMGGGSSMSSHADSSPNWRIRDQPPTQLNDGKKLDFTSRFSGKGSDSSTPSRADASYNWRMRDQPPTQSNDRNNNPKAQAASTTRVLPHHQNQEQQDRGFDRNGGKNNQHNHQSYKKK